MKKLITLTALICALLLALVGCDNFDTAGTTESTVSECEEHTYGEWETIRPSTCVQRGLRKRVCTVCGATEEGETVLVQHTTQAVGKVEPTCTENGHKSGAKCSVCGEIIMGCDVIEAKGHKFVNDECTECGEPSPVNDAYIVLYTEKKDSCIEVALRSSGFGVMVNLVTDIESSDEPDLNDFDIIIFDGVEPVAVPEGKAVWYINTPTLPSSLGTYGETVNTDTGAAISTVTDNRLGKQLANKLTLQDAAAGKYKKLLSIGDSLCAFLLAGTDAVAVAGEVDSTRAIALSFSMNDTNLPLLVTDFLSLVHNMVEYSILGLLPEPEPCTKHKETVIKGYDATCTEDGLSNGFVCSECGEILIPQEVKPAKGHKYNSEGVCKNCGEPKPE